MEDCLKYYAAACQTDLPSPLNRAEMTRSTERMLRMIDHAVIGYAPFMPVKLVVFPEFAHAAPAYLTLKELRDKLAVPVPNAHTEKLRAKAKEYSLYIQSGTMLETDLKWPECLQRHVSDRGRRNCVQIPQGQSLDSLRGPYEPTRS